jgi:type 2 lantibiotic biosynthesis protein LanM
MTPTNRASAPGLAKYLYAGLTLTERISAVRQADVRWVEQQINASRAAEAIARWKSQRPFSVGDNFEKRLHLDGLTEESLFPIVGLNSAVYSELLSIPPDWVRDLEFLYLSPCPRDIDPEFSNYAAEGTNGFLWFAYPLFQEALRRFRQGVARLPAEGVPFDAATVERLFVPHLLKTLEEALDLVMVLELNVARLQGALTGETPEERFRSFCDRLRQMNVQLSIAHEYPALLRSLYVTTVNWVDSSLELLERFSKDWDLIRANLAAGIEPGVLASIIGGAGDPHRHGRTVTILEFSTGFKLVYKPRSLSVDFHFGEFLTWLNQSGFSAPFRILNVIDRGGYGWCEFVTHQPCSNCGEVERFYQRLGGYLAIFYITRASDMHFENLIAAGEFPVPVDLETLFHPFVEEKEDPAAAEWQKSVLRVLLLPERILGSETQEGVDISGLGAKNGQDYPAGSASWDGTGTDEMRVVYNKAVQIPVMDNRPKLGEQDVAPEEFLEGFVMGFEWVYRLIEAHRDELQASGSILDRFGSDQVRFIGRPTHTYSILLAKALHPDMLRDAIDRDQLFDLLFATDLPHLARLIPAELQDLHAGDVPVFIGQPNSRDLWTSWGEPIPQVFEKTTIEAVHQGLLQLGDEDLTLQIALIRAAVSCAGEQDPPTKTPRKLKLLDNPAAIDMARAVGDVICRDALEYDNYASWIGLTLVGSREISWSVQPLDTGFYGGLSGCSFFLAYLGMLTGDRSYSKMAQKSINLVRRKLDRLRVSGLPKGILGGYSGLGGIIYTLSHLGVLWRDESLLDEAKSLASDVSSIIETDRMLDVIGGSAGFIAVLSMLNTISSSDRLQSIAMLCGNRLLQQQQPRETGVGWKTEIDSLQPLTGFSHGTAGIAWALLKLAAWSGQAHFRKAAESAIAYERSTFAMTEGNWPDYRMWPGEKQCDVRFMVA